MFIPPVLRGLCGHASLLTVLSMLIGVVLGVCLAIMRLSPNPILERRRVGLHLVLPRGTAAGALRSCSATWASCGLAIGVGLPFDQQIGQLFGIHDLNAQIFSVDAHTILLTGFVAGMLALGLSEAAYMAEIVRAGIQSIDPGQGEAAAALGLTPVADAARGSCCRRRCG